MTKTDKKFEDYQPNDIMKTCKHFDANEMGCAVFISNRGFACYPNSISLINVNDYTNVDIDEFMNERKKFFEDINSGKRLDCNGCSFLTTKKKKEINLEKIAWLNVASFETCNLRCKYCYFNDSKLGSKLNPNSTKLLPVVKKFASKNLLTDDICLAIAGGEPTLFEDIPETLNYLKENFKHPRFILQSNSSLTNRIESLIKPIKDFPNIWKDLYTSLDCGTSETYLKIKGRDLFKEVLKNLYNYAKKGVFTEMQIKYLLLDNKEKNMYNLSEDDIWGFANIIKQIVFLNKNKTTIVIDRDLKDFKNNQTLTDKMLRAGGILTFVAKKLNITFIYSACGYMNPDEITYMQNFAQNYDKEIKSQNEQKYYKDFCKSIKYLNLKKILQKANKIAKILKDRKLYI